MLPEEMICIFFSSGILASYYTQVAYFEESPLVSGTQH